MVNAARDPPDPLVGATADDWLIAAGHFAG
jgi:hypothetical protein